MKQKTDITKLSKSANIVFEGYSRALALAAKHSGITKSEADILVFFFNNSDSRTAGDLQKHRGFTEEYISDALKKLCKAGLTEINGEQITVTGKGSIIGIALKNAQQRFFDSLLAGVSDEENAVLQKIILKICENAEKIQ